MRRALLQQQQGPQPSGANGGVDCRDDQGCTPLHFAADRGLAPIAQLLLDHGADVNAKDADGQSPLHYAAICGRQELCSLLVAAGADVALEDADGATAKDAAPSGWPAAIWQRQQPQPAS